jgi:hypothetical protein
MKPSIKQNQTKSNRPVSEPTEFQQICRSEQLQHATPTLLVASKPTRARTAGKTVRDERHTLQQEGGTHTGGLGHN